MDDEIIGKRGRGRPRGTGKNQLIRRGLKSLPIYNTNSTVFLVGLSVIGNKDVEEHMRSGKVSRLGLRGRNLFLLLKDGTRVAV